MWDRYLSYGAAVGASRVASEVIDLGLADRRKIWSAYGGAWRVVQVRYPRVWPRYGQTAPKLAVRAIVALAVAYGLLRLGDWLADLDVDQAIDDIGAAIEQADGSGVDRTDALPDAATGGPTIDGGDRYVGIARWIALAGSGLLASYGGYAPRANADRPGDDTADPGARCSGWSGSSAGPIRRRPITSPSTTALPTAPPRGSCRRNSGGSATCTTSST